MHWSEEWTKVCYLMCAYISNCNDIIYIIEQNTTIHVYRNRKWRITVYTGVTHRCTFSGRALCNQHSISANFPSTISFLNVSISTHLWWDRTNPIRLISYKPIHTSVLVVIAVVYINGNNYHFCHFCSVTKFFSEKYISPQSYSKTFWWISNYYDQYNKNNSVWNVIISHIIWE